MTDSAPDPPFRHGVLAFGDSITNGGGELQWGVALQSWALWVARAAGLSFTCYAVDGANVENVVKFQIPALRSYAADPDARYELGCLYIGVNDVRALDWDPAAFERSFRAALAFLDERCERTLTMTVPLDLGRPRAGARKVGECNEAIERVASEHQASLVELRSFGARNLLMPDHVHPTAFGQIAIAERALAVLGEAPDPLPTRVPPRQMIFFETDWLGRLRGDFSYTYRHARVSAQAAGLLPRWRL
jgi:lysophospholipase L1-like esterase